MDESLNEQNMINKHKQERKDLNAKIQQMKHSIPKGNKKRKKELTIQIAQMEKELKEKQEQELKSLKNDDVVASHINNISINSDFIFEYKESKISKSQKKRERKAKIEKENEERIKAGTKLLEENSDRKLEEKRFKTIFDKEGLRLVDIPSDGDCMYKAIEHQLSLQGINLIVTDLRKRCSKVLRERKDEYLPFITIEDDKLINDDQYEAYCDKVEKTKAWGGNVELQALSFDLKLPIKVIQADGPPIDFGDQFKPSKPLLLSYHRHAYQLGEHYNSVVELK